VANVSGGTFEASDYGQYSFMAYGGGSLVMDESLVAAETAAAVKEREAEILGGLFRVNVNDDRPVSDN
jgi:hypothetical protein